MICKTCNCEKIESEMKTKTCCNECHKEKKRESNKKYYSNPENKEKKNKHDNEYYHENKEIINEKHKESLKTDPIKHQKKKDLDKKYYEQVKNDPEKLKQRRTKHREWANEYRQTDEGKKKLAENTRTWHKNNRDKINAWRRNHRKENEQFRLADNLRRAVKRVIYANGIQKTWQGEITKEITEAILNRIGSRPSDDVHLDHIIPISKFDLTIKEHRILANSPENLRWLPGKENLSKQDNVDFELIYCSLSLLSIAKRIGLV